MSRVCNLRANAARLKAEISIVRIIGEKLVLKPYGQLHIAVCPFRGDRTPSFTVYLDHFHCFGRGVHGDVFNWLMQAHCMTLPATISRPPPAPSSGSRPVGRVGNESLQRFSRDVDVPFPPLGASQPRHAIRASSCGERPRTKPWEDEPGIAQSEATSWLSDSKRPGAAAPVH